MVKRIFRGLLAAIMILAGTSHFTMTAAYAMIVPDVLPAAELLVYISGVFEILGGIGLLIPKLRQRTAWGLIALFVAVLPANLYQAMHGLQPPGLEMSDTMIWARLPLQLVPILWALWMTRPDKQRA